MSQQQLDALCTAAIARITETINRKAAQQVRRMREGWATKAGAAQ